MFKRNQLYTSLLVAGLVTTAGIVHAQQTLSSQASVTVQNAFTLAENTAMSFGTITASRGDTALSMELPVDGTAQTGDDTGTGNLTILTAGTPGEFEVTGAAAFTAMTVEMPTTAVTLSNAAAPPADPKFTVDTFKFREAGAGNTTITGSGSITTDATGGFVFNVGATLNLASGASKTLVDGDYVGNYDVTVSY